MQTAAQTVPGNLTWLRDGTQEEQEGPQVPRKRAMQPAPLPGCADGLGNEVRLNVELPGFLL